jgi:hypothetical protein
LKEYQVYIPILRGGLENADLFPMSEPRIVVYSYSKTMLYGGTNPSRKYFLYELNWTGIAKIIRREINE